MAQAPVKYPIGKLIDNVKKISCPQQNETKGENEIIPTHLPVDQLSGISLGQRDCLKLAYRKWRIQAPGCLKNEWIESEKHASLGTRVNLIQMVPSPGLKSLQRVGLFCPIWLLPV